jgi:hypothetical protein
MLRMNMRMLEDDAEEGIFEDEVEEDFGNDFIKQMMTGEGVEGYDEEEWEEIEEDQYPKHAERRPLEKQFDRMMDDFDMDEGIEEEDPRAHGALDVMDYAPALEEFIQDHAGASYLEAEQPARNRGLVNQFRHLAGEHRVFDSNAEGHFVTTLDSDKGARMGKYYHEDMNGLKQLTLQAIRDGQIDTADILFTAEEEKLVPVQIKARANNGERLDCETVLTTYSNAYNNPSVIGGQTKKIKLTIAAAKKAKAEQAAARAERHADAAKSAGKKSPAMGPIKIGANGLAVPPPMAAAAAPVTEEDELFADLPDEALPNMMDLSTRPKDESKEEKALRRALVKELQRERRSEKKSTKTAYKQAGIAHANIDQKQKMDKKVMSMSVVRRA